MWRTTQHTAQTPAACIYVPCHNFIQSLSIYPAILLAAHPTILFISNYGDHEPTIVGSRAARFT